MSSQTVSEDHPVREPGDASHERIAADTQATKIRDFFGGASQRFTDLRAEQVVGARTAACASVRVTPEAAVTLGRVRRARLAG